MRIEDAPLHTLYSRLSTRSRCAGEGAKTRGILPISGSADKHFLAESYEPGVWNRTNWTGTPFHWILPRFGNSRNVKMGLTLIQPQAAADFLGRDAAFPFDPRPGTLNDSQKSLISAQRYRLIIRIANRHDGRKRLPAFHDDDRCFSSFLRVLRQWSRCLL